MDQELETFVGLLNKNRAVRSVPDEFAHLPNWAQQALTRLPETVPPRRIAPLNGAMPEPKRKPNVAIAPPPPAIAAPAAPAASKDPLAAIIRELAKPIEPPAPRVRPAVPAAPIAIAPIALGQAPAVARVEPPSSIAAPEPVELVPATEASTDNAPVIPANPGVSVLDIVVRGNVPVPVDMSAGALTTTTPHVEKKTDGTSTQNRPGAAIAIGTAVVAAMAVIAGGYWYANQSGLSVTHGSMSLAREGMSLARNLGALIPPLPSAMKTFDEARSTILGGKARSDAVAASDDAAPAPVAPAPQKIAAAAAPSFDKLAAVAATKPAFEEKIENPVADAVVMETRPAPAMAVPVPETNPAAFQQVAMLTGPLHVIAPPAGKSVPESGAEPTWRRNAVVAPPYDGRPQIAIVIDDLGIDSNRTGRAIELDGAVTLSFLAYASNLAEQTEAARKAGHELIVHVPMEPVVRPKFISAGSDNLAQGELLRRLRWDLSRFSGYVGVNNHMGNRLASDPESTETVVSELKTRGLLFLDYRGSNGGVAAVAERLGVPTVSRDVFLDDDVGAASVNERLAALEKVARTQGTAVAIGHPHDRTLEALRAWLASMPAKGLQLVPLTAIVRDREQHVARAN